MTLTHISFDIVRRLESSALKTAAYIACGVLLDGERKYDFSRKSNELVQTAVLLPSGSPPMYLDPQQLWSAAESMERQANGQSARQVLISIPRGVPRDLWGDFARTIAAPWVNDGMAAHYAIHDTLAAGGGRNIHIHYQLSMRRMSDAGFAKVKAREWNLQFREDNGRGERQRICDRANQFFIAQSLDIHMDPRTLAEQGIDRPPEPDASRQWQQWKREGASAEQAPASVMRVLRHREMRQTWQKAAHETAIAEAEIYKLEAEIARIQRENAGKIDAALTERAAATIALPVNKIEGRIQMARRPQHNRPQRRTDSWTRGTSGIDGLSDRQRAEAEKAHDQWLRDAGDRPRTLGLSEYIDYVQDRRAREERKQTEEAADMHDETPSIVAARTIQADSITPTSADAAERSRRTHLEALLAERYKAPAPLLAHIQKYETDKDGRHAVLHTAHGRILDHGDRLEHAGEINADLARATIATAAAKGWSSLKVSGGPDYREAIAIAAAIHRPPISTDHELSGRGCETVRKLTLKEAAASVHPADLPADGSPAEQAAARIRHELERCERLLATEPQGLRSGREIAAPRLTELAERRERAREDAAEAIKAAADHREAHGWTARLLDPASRRRQASLDAEAAALDREARRLDRRHEKSVRKIERQAEKEAKSNAATHQDWRWSKEIRTTVERRVHLGSILTAVVLGDEATIAAMASGDIKSAYTKTRRA